MKEVRITIAVASSGMGHVARGVEAWAYDLSRALADRGERVVLCKGGGTPDAQIERVIPCWKRGQRRTTAALKLLPRFRWRFGLGSAYDIEQATFTRNLLKLLRHERIDILHVQDPRVAALVQRARQLGLVRTRVILAHGTEESLEFQSKITYLQHLAPWHLEEARAAGYDEPTWTAIPNFIDTDVFSPARGDELRDELRIPRDALVVLCTAAIKRNHKRVDWLLAEFAELRRRLRDLQVWLVVAGGWEKETDDLLAEGQKALGDRVRFLVRFPRQRMPELYRAADLFTLCSLKEMMPIALLEATASGLPCLVHGHPVMQWMIGPGGQSVEMTVPGALATAWADLLATSDRRLRLADESRRHCIANFSKDRIVDQILQYYQFVMSHGAKVKVQGTKEERERTTGRSHEPHRSGTRPNPLPECEGITPVAADPSVIPHPSSLISHRVSVVIPAYRAARTIVRAVESVLAQTRAPTEIIVVDDGSPDDLAAPLAPYREKVKLIRKANGGAASARNMGIEEATGDFIAFLDADDYWSPQKLQHQIGIFQRHPEVGLVAGRFFVQAPGGGEQRLSDGDNSFDRVLRLGGEAAFRAATRIWTGTVIVKRAVLGDNRFVSGLEPAEDRDLWVRLVAAAPIYLCSEPLATAVLEPNSLSRSNVARDCSNMLRVVRRNRQLLGRTAARMWESHTLYRWGACEDGAGPALSKLARSWLLWPLPYDRELVNQPSARVKASAVSVLRLLRLRRYRSNT